MNLPHGAIVAVVDGEKLLMLRNKGLEPHVELIELPKADIDAENTGSGSRHRSSAANPDGSRQAEDNFASSTAAYLNRQVLEGKVEHLLIIADPRTLGELRKHFHAALEPKLIGQIAKDLTGHSIEAIEAAIVNG